MPRTQRKLSVNQGKPTRFRTDASDEGPVLKITKAIDGVRGEAHLNLPIATGNYAAGLYSGKQSSSAPRKGCRASRDAHSCVRSLEGP
jgi:hypothetical protein